MKIQKIKIQNGEIIGKQEENGWGFRGIPFAKSPIGDLRFKPPVPVNNWSEALECVVDGTRPSQNIPSWCSDAETHNYGEDCLNLNVWTPNPDNKKRPVLVYFFGGGHVEGSNSESGIDGERFAGERDIVVVTPNYRLGALGYLYLGHLLSTEYASSGNLGLLDQILALQWVQSNISFFGGDPEHITIMGQSAGGKSVANLILAPKAHGLFQAAIIMSGALQSVKSIETEKALTENFMSAAKLSENRAEEILTMPLAKLLEAQKKANETYFQAESYGATADGIVLPLNFENTCDLPNIPIMLGHTLEELFLPIDGNNKDIKTTAMKKKMHWKFGKNGEHVFRKYVEARHELGFTKAYGEIISKYTYFEAYLRTAELFVKNGMQVYLYRWDFKGSDIAGHCSDINAILGKTDIKKKQNYLSQCNEVESIAKEAWGNFIETGTPVTARLAEWKPYSKDFQRRMLIDIPCKTADINLSSYDKEFQLQVMKL